MSEDLESEEIFSDDSEEILEDSEESVSTEEYLEENATVITPQNFKANISQTDLAFIAGKRRSGKTNLIIWFIDRLTNLNANILIIDPVLDIDEALKKLYGRADPRIVNIGYQNRTAFNSFLFKLIKKGWKGLLIIDEADGFFPNKKSMTKIEKFFIHIGRHYGIGAILVTRRMSNMNTDIATQANIMMIFKHWQRADLDYLSQSGLIEELPIIRKLPKHHFQYIDIDGEVSVTSKPVPKML